MQLEQRKSPSERKRVLLVEDDASARRAIQLLLQSHGYDVRAYGSSAGLAEMPEALAASCLVADLMLGDGDGFSLLRKLRDAGWPGRALLISGHLTPDRIDRGIAEGFDAVLAKPVPERELVAAIDRLVH
jgi:CheY-like chemotaxis protein